ncbi:uncharacterized protein LOC9312872 isoform X4 [Arabidopsis lyrata subsp. lyrata]|uniref:uncharacterized protein LOC9312872 isoform X4 n=1 Tax=Arabidopsis lyrata subsp. lyrata TaxID=81972 RepID=UPI000A29BD0A|nr:uncharacterized protein LOC9312872 isoform X4 [Arabidopsis lyrata subsp. lyrata]|eukprot:XP_020881078.1 uncharacterized protein LOC9312872 isoform X4 [Arabidopsis lyrata subsp. lyrata]
MLNTFLINTDWKVKVAAKMGPSDLADFLEKVPDKYPPLPPVFRLFRFLDYYDSALSGVACPWRQMFQESNLAWLFDVIDVPLSYIPEPVYQTSVDWINQHVPENLRCGFVLSTFNYILRDLLPQGVKEEEATYCHSKVAMFVTLAMVVRSKPRVLTKVLPSLRLRRIYKGQGQIPLTVWLITQASKDDLSVGLLSWAHNLLPLVGSNPQSTDVILKLVEKILAKPDDQARFVKTPVWQEMRLIPPQSFEILLRLTFPASLEPTTSRFVAIYPLLKKVALVRTSRSQAIEEIFTFSLRLSGEEGNTVLAEEARSIALWSLTVNKDCWKHWENLYDQNLKATIALLKILVGNIKYGVSEAIYQQIFTFSLRLAGEGSPGSKAWKQITRKIFTISLKLAGEVTANPVLAEEATTMAIWSLTENVDCWKNWDNLYQENLEASVAILKKLVEEWKDHSLKLLSSPSGTLTLDQTMKSFMVQNKNAITGGRANCSLYKKADKSCKVIWWRLSRVRSTLNIAVVLLAVVFKSCKLIRWRSNLTNIAITAVVLVAVVILALVVHMFYLPNWWQLATAGLKNMLDSLDVNYRKGISL